MKIIMVRKFILISVILSFSSFFSFAQSTQTEKIRYINILAVRVEFVEDDIETTNGNGKFDLSDTSAALIDPPPHNRLYFEDHLEALKRYYYKISGGKVVITYDVFPKESDESYQLPEQMVYYNPNTTEEGLDQGLSELLRDAFLIFDGEEDIDYSAYNCFLVFHAGVGSDFTLVDHPSFDPTPSDLPSVYLDFKHLKNTLGEGDPQFKGIPVAGNTLYITDGLIFPETESKEGIELGLNGIIAHQFAHKLGLPPLFNTVTGKPAIGKWGLMDVGFGNFLGLIPPKPSAWSRAFMGWERPEEIMQDGQFFIGNSGEDGYPTLYKVSISPEEYFLIENRQRDPGNDSLNIVHSPRGVLLEVDDYDWDIPGSGLLVWHIDERIIGDKIGDNKINEDMKRRGVDLEEADGAEDIGENFDFVPPGFFTPENGVAEDAFYQDNNIEFTPYTIPGSNSNSGAFSHIFITGISESNRLMSFSVKKDYSVPSFPIFLGEELHYNNPVWNGISNNYDLKIATLAGNNTITAINNNGNSVIDSYKETQKIELNGDTSFYDVPYFSDIEGQHIFSPVLYENIGLNRLQLTVAAGEGKLRTWGVEDKNADGTGDLLFEKDIGVPISAEPFYSNGVIIGDVNGKAYYYNANGLLLFEKSIFSSAVMGIAAYETNGIENFLFVSESGGAALVTATGEIEWNKQFNLDSPFNPSVGDITGDYSPEIISCDSSGNMVFLDGNGSQLEEFAPSGTFDFISPPSIGDLDNDGFPEVVICGKKYIYAFSRSGTLKDGFPIEFDWVQEGKNIATIPVLGDLNGDENVDIVVGSDRGEIYAFSYDGSILSGFPLTCGSNVASSVSLIQNPENGNVQLMVKSTGGYLFLWEFPFRYDSAKIPWGEYLHDSRHTSLTKTPNMTPAAPSGELMPAGRVYNYPNPAEGNSTTIRYYLNYSAEVTISIVNLAGELVTELKGPGNAQTDNEVSWPLSGISNGVYLAKVEAVSADGKSIKFIKIAVSK